MLIDFNNLPEVTTTGMNGGTGEMSSKFYADKDGKIIVTRIHPGGSIGPHRQTSGDDINYVLSGEGLAICDGVGERLVKGVCHVCKKGSEHSIVNTGKEDLVLFTVVLG